MTIDSTRTVLAIGAHPDDVELLCAGTLVLLHAKGWNVECATMTPGDCGSSTRTRAEISAIRKKEAAASAALLNGKYHCMECDDVFITYDRPTLLNVIKLIRQVKPEIVFTMSPEDYMVDHEITSEVVRTACFAAGMKNIDTDGIEPFLSIPHLYYLDPMEGKDILGNPIRPTTIVDITSTMAKKEQMFLCHESQRSWLKSHHGVDESVESMRASSLIRGKTVGVRYAEGFRQHLGHAYPQDNSLRQELNSLVHLVDYPGTTEKGKADAMGQRRKGRWRGRSSDA
jgi:LmbE family N-acetylglucosaminyl deacetylase